MTKFYGLIGYAVSYQPEPYVHKDYIEEVPSYGEVLRTNQRYTEGEGVNDTLTLGVTISVMMDAYISKNVPHIRYVEYLGAFWKVREVVPDEFRPRLLLRLGGVYNGPRPEQPDVT